MLTLPRDQYDALETADNTRRALAKTKAANAATTAFLSYASQVLPRRDGTDHGQALLKLLNQAPTQPLAVCLNALGYVIGADTTDRAEQLCYVVVLDDDSSVVRVFADPEAAYEFSGATDAGIGTKVLDIPFEPITRPLPLELDLDMLAYDIADTMDKGEYGLGDVSQDDIRAVLPEFLSAALAHSEREGRS
jgi:hypothetical protein